MDKYKQRKQVAEWLNKQGYELELDKDGLWMEDYDFTEHKTKDVIDLMIAWAGNLTNSKPANCAIFDVSKMCCEWDDYMDIEMQGELELIELEGRTHEQAIAASDSYRHCKKLFRDFVKQHFC